MWLAALRAKFKGTGTLFGREEFDRLLGHCQVWIFIPPKSTAGANREVTEADSLEGRDRYPRCLLCKGVDRGISRRKGHSEQ